MTKLSIPVGKQDHILGNPKALVTLLEYGDFECPYCKQAHPIVKAILAQLKDKVRFVFRHFPLSQIHPHALHAAFAAEAAGKQGKFWQMHDLLFLNQHALEDEDLIAYAESLDLETRVFVEDMQSPEVQKKVHEDFIGGVRSGVNGTPTFFINGRRFDSSYEFDSLLMALDEEYHIKLKRGIAAI